MHKYVFILGREWRLSVNEIFSVFGNDNAQIIEDTLVKGFGHELQDPQIVQDKLGGTIKIAEVIDEVDSLNKALKSVSYYLTSLGNPKVIFSMSVFNFAHKSKIILKKLLKDVKKNVRMKVEGKVRFLNKPDENIKSTIVFEEKLVQKGTDINVIKNGGRYIIARSVSVQNYKKYSKRDYERPARDAKSGMLPPKLAQILINLACEGAIDMKVYDPFCGSGTILMEGLLMGYKVIGSDISEKAVKDSWENLEWIINHFRNEKLVNKDNVIDIFQKDAAKLEKGDLKNYPDCIVCETYLGPPLSKLPTDEEMKRNFKEIEKIVIDALKGFTRILKKDGSVVIVVPFYRIRGKNYFLENLLNGFKDLNILIDPLFESTKRDSLLYFRNDQLVGREIFKLKLS